MKRLTICLALLCGAAQADIIAYTGNRGGGKIVITDETSKNCVNGMRVAYTVSEANRTTMGCWVIDTLHIHVVWSDGDVRSYPLDGWEFVKASKGGRSL